MRAVRKDETDTAYEEVPYSGGVRFAQRVACSSSFKSSATP